VDRETDQPQSPLWRSTAGAKNRLAAGARGYCRGYDVRHERTPFCRPGPTNIPDRVLRAMDRPIVDHRSPEFAQLTEDVRGGLRRVFGTRDGAPMLYPSSGTGATEAALVNALAPGDRAQRRQHPAARC
jgi:hypothetical protein